MHDVFISYSTENQTQAEKIRDILRANGITCWFAPSTIRGTQDFTKEIPPAIRNSRAFLLLMSRGAQESKWVKRELGVADKTDVPIYTFFLEDCALSDDFDFVLQFNQHYKAELGFDEQVRRLMAELREDLQDPDKAVRPSSKTEQTGAGTGKKKNRLPLILGAVAVVVAAVIAAVLLLGGGLRDGSYVLWNPANATALSGDPINAHYHAGETVLGHGDTLSSYTAKCVWELDFDGDTFTMSRDGELLGVQPGYNGIGLGGDYTANRWELVDAGDGLYYIRNTETGYYLEWYKAKENWSTYDKITPENQDQFLIRIDPAK